MAKKGTIFAASAGRDIVELNKNLDQTNLHWGRDNQPIAMDANEEYLVVGYRKGLLAGFSHIDVKGRRDNLHDFQIFEVNFVLELLKCLRHTNTRAPFIECLSKTTSSIPVPRLAL